MRIVLDVTLDAERGSIDEVVSGLMELLEYATIDTDAVYARVRAVDPKAVYP